MSKLLTDLMEAERRRRQLAISRGAKDAAAKTDEAAFAADETLRARIEAEHLAAAEADRWKRIALCRTPSGAYPPAAEMATEQSGAEPAVAAVHSRTTANDEALRARIEAEHLAVAGADPWKRVALGRTASGAYPLGSGKAAERSDAEPFVAAAHSCTVAERGAELAAVSRLEPERMAEDAAARPATAMPEAAPDTASPRPGPRRTGWRLFAATALASTAGIGAGFWLGKPPAVSVRPWPEDQGVLRLRLDDRLTHPPLQQPRMIPRDSSQ